MHFASNRLKWKPREMSILLPTNRHYRQTLLPTFHADSSALPISFIVDAAWCLSPPATSASKLSEKIIRFQRRIRLSLQTWASTVRASPAFHWKNGLHASFGCSNAQKQCKSGCGYTKYVHDTGVFKGHGTTKNTAAGWVFTFTAHTLAATDCLVALIGHTTCGL